jgi:hypothetical protein
VPTSGANSIATIITHVIGSEAETIRSVAGVASERNRAAEFGGDGLTKRDVLGLLDVADRLLSELVGHLDPERLSVQIRLPTLPAEEMRLGLTWLVANYGHAREHLGQIQLTRQLRQSPPP